MPFPWARPCGCDESGRSRRRAIVRRALHGLDIASVPCAAVTLQAWPALLMRSKCGGRKPVHVGGRPGLCKVTLRGALVVNLLGAP